MGEPKICRTATEVNLVMKMDNIAKTIQKWVNSGPFLWKKAFKKAIVVNVFQKFSISDN